MISVSYTSMRGCQFTQSQVEKIVSETAKYEKKIKGEVEINIVGDKKIREINRAYRAKNAVTDVLSFAWREGSAKDNNLGQIFISFDQIKRQSGEYNVPVKQEFVRMLVHGLLHLVGYDHMEKKDEKKMFVLQEKIVSKINI